MDRIEQARERAFQYHQSGFHCAEAVSRAVFEIYDPSIDLDMVRAASAFGGGLGRSNQELCGALAGGVVAIGFLFGRTGPDKDWGKAADLAAELRTRFAGQNLTTRCEDLLASFGPQENMHRCKQLSGETAAMLAGILEEQNEVRGEGAVAGAGNAGKCL